MEQFEKLTAENYPKLYEGYLALKARVQADFPDEYIPDVYMNVNGSYAKANYGFLKREFIEKYGYEAIVLSKAFFDDYEVNTTLAVIAHELGHDVLDSPFLNSSFSEQSHECQADHFSAYYTSAQDLADYFREESIFSDIVTWVNSMIGKHISNSDRIAMLENEIITSLPVGTIEFNSDCTVVEMPEVLDIRKTDPFSHRKVPAEL